LVTTELTELAVEELTELTAEDKLERPTLLSLDKVEPVDVEFVGVELVEIELEDVVGLAPLEEPPPQATRQVTKLKSTRWDIVLRIKIHTMLIIG